MNISNMLCGSLRVRLFARLPQRSFNSLVKTTSPYFYIKEHGGKDFTYTVPSYCSGVQSGFTLVKHGKESNGENRTNGMQEEKKARKCFCGQLSVKDADSYVELCGHLKLLRLNKFYLLNDGTGSLQVVVSKKEKKIKRLLSEINESSLVTMLGYVRKRVNASNCPGATDQGIEVFCDNITSVVRTVTDDNEAHSGFVPVTEEEADKCLNVFEVQQLNRRSHACGKISKNNIGDKVFLCGWIEAKEDGKFIILKDGYGSVKIIPGVQDNALHLKFEHVGPNSMIKVQGYVSSCPVNESSTNNVNTKNNAVCVFAESLTIINDGKSETRFSDSNDVEEATAETVDDPAVSDRERLMNISNKYTMRTHNCGELNENHIGQRVHLMGWLQFCRMNKFLVLKDKYGQTQMLIPDGRKDLQEHMENVTLNSVISAQGIVSARPRNQEKPNESTGMIEVIVSDLQVISKSEIGPFTTKNSLPGDFIRLQYRYLDLRLNKCLQDVLHARCDIIHKMRRFMIESLGFLEVETPTLFKRTPGGAQEFIVPTKKEGEFYCLVQSPQQFKQLLMIGAVDKYFQFARCYRDEEMRKDRQPEFTQLDIELSFTSREFVLNLVEDLLKHVWPRNLPPISTPFPRMTYEEVINLYGTDKPDLRFDLKLHNMTELFKDDEDCKAVEDFAAYAFVVNHKERSYTAKQVKEINSNLKDKYNDVLFKAIRISNISVTPDPRLVEIFGLDKANAITAIANYNPEDTLFMALGSKNSVLNVLNEIRADNWSYMEKHNKNNQSFKFLWVVDFPLFEKVENEIKSLHHPFTQPHPDDLHLLSTEPLKVRSLHYDLVLNGYEIGGGSIRIHDPLIQKEIFENILKIDTTSLKYFISALSYGTPPHGGIALGMDRLISILYGTQTIRDVIAFPKSGLGRDALSGAPCNISEKEKILYHISKSSNVAGSS